MSFVPFVRIPVPLLNAAPSRDVHVYGAIASHEKDWVAFPGQQLLSEETHSCERTVRNAVTALAARGWLDIEKQPTAHGHCRNRYHLRPVGRGTRFPFFAAVPVRLIREGTAQQVHVYGVIQHHANSAGVAHPTQVEIAAEWGKKVRQTRDVIGQLAAGGWLTVAPRFLKEDDDPFGYGQRPASAQHKYQFPPVGKIGRGARSPNAG